MLHILEPNNTVQNQTKAGICMLNMISTRQDGAVTHNIILCMFMMMHWKVCNAMTAIVLYMYM